MTTETEKNRIRRLHKEFSVIKESTVNESQLLTERACSSGYNRGGPGNNCGENKWQCGAGNTCHRTWDGWTGEVTMECTGIDNCTPDSIYVPTNPTRDISRERRLHESKLLLERPTAAEAREGCEKNITGWGGCCQCYYHGSDLGCNDC